MPNSAGRPVVPTTRAVAKIMGDITGQTYDVDEPRMGRADQDDELWRTAESRIGDIEDEYERNWPEPQRAAAEPRAKGLPQTLDFDGARSHALQAQTQREEKLARSQLRQPELSRDMEDWATHKDRQDEEGGRPRHGPWCLVPERQINLSTLRGEHC